MLAIVFAGIECKRKGALLLSIRVLLVDDRTDWRKKIRWLLQERPELQIIFEASDGIEAVQKARELKPDLILVDIGLPKLNGIEAVRQIGQHSPNSKIVFVSMETSADIVRAALSVGARGYVYKAGVQSDLLPAIDAVLRGMHFVPSILRSRMSTNTTKAKASHHHEVQFYSDDTVFLDRLVRFFTSVLNAGDVAIIIATETHQKRLVQRLKLGGLDVDAAITEGRYLPIDAVSTLSLFMVDDMPDSARFLEIVGCLIEQTAKKGKAEHPRVAIFGEWVSLLWAEGKVDAVIRLEQLGNQLATTYGIHILCGYALSSVQGVEDGEVLQRICAEHSAVYISGNR
jgi:DNA-binding NarL/FixJ family response regulator